MLTSDETSTDAELEQRAIYTCSEGAYGTKVTCHASKFEDWLGRKVVGCTEF